VLLEVERPSRFLEEERRVLHLVAKGASIQTVLDTLTDAIERMAPGCFCSILLLDEDRRHLRTGAGGRLPKDYLRLVDGLEIGPEVGSCGTAAFRNETVIVADIATDFRWASAKELPLGFGLKACWSVPIRDSKDGVLGTFAMYHQAPAVPSPQDLAIVEAGAHLAGNAIERLTADRKLRDAVERLQLAEEAAGFGVWDYDILSDAVTLSEGAAVLSGFTKEKLRSSATELNQLIHAEDLPATKAAIDEAIRHGQSYQTEFRVMLPDGSLGWRRTQGRVEFAGGQARRIIGAIIDISKEKMMVEQLRENERQLAHKLKLESLGQLAAGIAHEINTPVQYIGDNARFLQDAFQHLLNAADAGGSTAPASDELEAGDLEFHRQEIPKALDQLIEGVQQVSAIVRAMKEFSHPGPLERLPIDLNQGIESAILVSRNEWKYVADVSTDFDPELPPVPCLAGEFNQVILNLIVNAAHAISEVPQPPNKKGEIRIQTRRDGAYADIRVSDTGCGIPESIQSKVFDPFFTTKPVGKGTGQGLALAHAVIVQKHKGTIRVDSKPGSGTTMVIRLPLSGLSA